MSQRKIVSCFLAVFALLTLAGCDFLTTENVVMASYVNAQQFEKVKMLCMKNDGLMSVHYLVELKRGNSIPQVAYCNDGARFDVPKDIQGKK